MADSLQVLCRILLYFCCNEFKEDHKLCHSECRVFREGLLSCHFCWIWMDHEPSCGLIALCHDLGSAPCPLSLPVFEFHGGEGDCSPGMVEYYACNFTAQYTHRVMLLVCSEKTVMKTDNLVFRSSEYCSLLSRLSYKSFK